MNQPLTNELLPPIPGPFGFTGPNSFEKSSDSPFPDQYSIEREKIALADLLQSDDPNPADPRYPRLEQLAERERELKQMSVEWKLRSGAEKLVPDNEAMRLRVLGVLVDETVDSMTLHTKEAFRLFMGRTRDTEGKLAPIIGGKRIASALKSLWYLSGNDNPYADWALLRHTQVTEVLRQQIADQSAKFQQDMETLSKRGLTISVLRSNEPKSVELGFKSPYGYSVAELIVEYDYFVRIVKTLIRKDRYSDTDGQNFIKKLTRSIRASFEEVARFERYLMKQELRTLSRSDFLPGASDEAVNRVAAVNSIYGSVPGSIFTGKLVPRHSRRRANVSAQELALLEQIAESNDREMAEEKGNDESGLV